MMTMLRPCLLALALLAACSTTGGGTDAGTNTGDDAGVSPYRDYVLEGCEHMNNGPDLTPDGGPSVTAVADPATLTGNATASLPVEHGVSTVNLVDYQGQKGGHLALAWSPVATGAQLWIAVEQEGVPLEVLHEGSPHAATASIPRGELPAGCGSDPRKVGHLYVWDLPSGDYVLRVGPNPNAAISVVAVDSSEAEEE